MVEERTTCALAAELGVDVVGCSSGGERSLGEVGRFDNFEVAGGVEVHDVDARDAGHFFELFYLFDADS